MGSKSLAETVVEMLSRPEGEVTYDFYGERSVVFKKFPLTGWIYAIGIVTGKPGQPVEELPPILSELEKEITLELNKMDQDLGVARRLSEKILKRRDEKNARDLLSYSHAGLRCRGSQREDGAGRAPKYEFEGKDISAQEQIIRWELKNRF
jgi:hypothetical protein